MILNTLTTKRDLSDLLDLNYSKQFIYYVYRKPFANQYKKFKIPKKRGGERQISAPVTPLKLIQQKLLPYLEELYRIRPPVHGYVRGRSIISGAQKHLRKRLVLNVDLENFFDSINFGRVWGMLISKPYMLSHEVATAIARIVCLDNKLPQGAPTSPIISNRSVLN
jgi:RNA-directed DNA polymerase